MYLRNPHYQKNIRPAGSTLKDSISAGNLVWGTGELILFDRVNQRLARPGFCQWNSSTTDQS